MNHVTLFWYIAAVLGVLMVVALILTVVFFALLVSKIFGADEVRKRAKRK